MRPPESRQLFRSAYLPSIFFLHEAADFFTGPPNAFGSGNCKPLSGRAASHADDERTPPGGIPRLATPPRRTARPRMAAGCDLAPSSRITQRIRTCCTLSSRSRPFDLPERERRGVDRQPRQIRKKPRKGLFSYLAEREGFEPSIELLTLYSLSRGAPSATRASLRICAGCSLAARLNLPLAGPRRIAATNASVKLSLRRLLPNRRTAPLQAPIRA